MTGYNSLIQSGITESQRGFSQYKNTLLQGFRAITGLKVAPNMGKWAFNSFVNLFADYFNEEDEGEENAPMEIIKWNKAEKRELLGYFDQLLREAQWQSKAISMKTGIQLYRDYIVPPPVAPPVAHAAPTTANVSRETSPAPASAAVITSDQQLTFSDIEDSVADFTKPTPVTSPPVSAVKPLIKIGPTQPLGPPLLSSNIQPIQPIREIGPLTIGPLTIGQNNFTQTQPKMLDFPGFQNFNTGHTQLSRIQPLGSSLGSPLL